MINKRFIYMKSFSRIIKTIIYLFFCSNFILSSNNLKKTISLQIIEPVITKIGFNTNGKGNNVVTSKTMDLASRMNIIPPNHPVLQEFIKPKYVEQLKFYEDKPKLKIVEVNTYGTGDDAYYIPKLYNKIVGNDKLISHIYHNCEDIDSSHLCQNAQECGKFYDQVGWDNSINLCVFLPSKSNEIKFEN